MSWAFHRAGVSAKAGRAETIRQAANAVGVLVFIEEWVSESAGSCKRRREEGSCDL
jgi:hypothetical protein